LSDGPETIDELEERARRLFSGPVTFLKSAPQLKFLPDPDMTEIAFCGRSNVGKSSLLNNSPAARQSRALR
jgi:GTP-binding protein